MIRVHRIDLNNSLHAYADHLKNLSVDDKYSRFGFTASDDLIDKLILNMLYSPEKHQLFAAVDGERAVGFGHIAIESNDVWELALSVDSKFQGKGCGTLILKELVDQAIYANVKEIYMHCIESNKKIQHLASKFNLKTRSREFGERTAVLEVPEATVVDRMIDAQKKTLELFEEFDRLTKKFIDLTKVGK